MGRPFRFSSYGTLSYQTTFLATARKILNFKFLILNKFLISKFLNILTFNHLDLI